MRFAQFAACLFLLLAPTIADAAMVTRTFCARYTVDYPDLTYGDSLTTSPEMARGAKLRFIDAANHTTDFWLDEGGTTPGCKSIALDDSTGVAPYTIKLLKQAQLGNNIVEVTDSSSHDILAATLATNYSPVTGQITWTQGAADSTRIIAAAAWAMHSRDTGLTNTTFEFHVGTCPDHGAGDSCYHRDANGAYVVYVDSTSKFVIVHELGHFVFDASNGYAGVSLNWDAGVEDCKPGEASYTASGQHIFNSTEYASAASWEGAASFFAALVFNSDPGSSCEYWKNNVDWNLDGSVGGSGDPDPFSCTGYEDFYGTYCETSNGNNRATQYDWMRALLELDESGLLNSTLPDILTFYADSHPNTWTASGNGTGGSYPASRFHTAAGTMGWQTWWDYSAASNGVNR